MDSMKRSEASTGHHQNKVVLTNQATESNNKVNLSGSNLNNNTVSNKQQHQSALLNPNQTSGAQVSTPSNTSNSSISVTSDTNKDSNFEYDDNEWDVGIGDLIIDLDADIEKSSVSDLTSALGDCSTTPTASSQSGSTLPIGPFLNTQNSDCSETDLRRTQCVNPSTVLQKDSSLKLDSSTKGVSTCISVKRVVLESTPTKEGTTSSTPSKHHSSSSSSSSSSFTSGHHHHHHHHHHKSNSGTDSGIRTASNPSKHSVLLSQLNSSKHTNPSFLLSSEISGLKHHHNSCSVSNSVDNCTSTGLDLDTLKSSRSSSSSTMSSTTSSSGGKSATKLSVDHQATLDKGLKMKIKRTKPGTKTSEAKHEIVKAEQNGTSSLSSSNADENNSNSNSSSNSSNKKHSSQSQSQTQQQVAGSPNISQQQQQQGAKRGSSGHRRDKTKDKATHHTQRDKNEHNSSSSSSGSCSSTSSSGERGCNCTHEMQVNGIQQPCSSISCIRSRTSDQSMGPLSQRISNQNNSSTSSSNSLFSSNSITGSSLSSSSSSNTPNAPGPPSSKDSSKSKPVVPITIHSSSQISSAAAANSSQLSNLQHSTSSSGSSCVGSGNSSSGSSSNTSSSSSSGSSSSGNNALKSQLQSTVPPTSLLNALSSGSSVTASPNVALTSGSLSSHASSNALSMVGETGAALVKEEKISTSPPPAKRHKCEPKDMVDVCVGTSVGTITEPDCLGPCEPGTSVTLEGIVWHETEGGVLVVNVTWRGKTYVGTLIDCTKHDWAPPRFCDSPTEEFDSRTPKGRGKRGRNSTLFPINDLSNFTETRSSMHSKLRNGGAKGRGCRGITTTAESNSSKTTATSTTTTASSSSGTTTSASSDTPSTSPVAFLPPRPEKRKSKDESPSPVNGGGGSASSSSGTVITSNSVSNANASGIVNNGIPSTQSVVNPMTGLNVQISTKKCKNTASPCAVSPVLLECPEQDCSKKYKHANGLRYHQSHAHGSVSSMDEDSSHTPESPQRVAPPTTPSPVPTTTVQSSSLPTVSVSNTTLLPVTSIAPAVTTPVSSSAPQSFVCAAVTSSVSQSTTTATSSTVTDETRSINPPSKSPSPSLLVTANVANTAQLPTPHSLLISTTQSLATTSQIGSQSTVTSPATAGGSITTGVACPSQPHASVGSNTTLLSTVLANNPNTLLSQAPPSQVPSLPPSQQHLSAGSISQGNSNILPATSTRCDPNLKGSKSGVLRFGPLPSEGDQNARLTPVTQTPSNLTGTPGSLQAGAQQSTPVRPSAVSMTGGLLALQPSTPGTPEGLSIKSQNCSKQKKNRKSPGPSDFDIAAANRAEDVQSPAYSDISDDSAPVVDASDLDKTTKGSQLVDVSKKPNEGIPGQLAPLSGYGMYPYYPGMPHQPPYYAPDHTGKPPGLGHSPLGSNANVDYKNKEPPLDLMNKPNQHQQQQPPPSQQGQPPHNQQLLTGDIGSQANKEATGVPLTHPGAGKMMQHFYPYGYMPTGFSYNIDPNYGPVSMISEDSKLGQQPPPSGQIKEERIKESPSPNDYAKMGSQMVSAKLIKSEPTVVKDIKTEGAHSIHSKEQPPPGQPPGQSSISAYGGMFQRHGLNMGPSSQQPQHMNREDDLRRLFNYSDQRRSNTSGNSSISNINPKDEPSSPSQSQTGHQIPGSAHCQTTSQSSTNTSHQQQKSSKNALSSQQQMKQQKDIKTEDKELLKVKQEGQKPTMETQGPPPPPTSQYYPHSLYMSAAPFGFDPNHQMYRNMLVPTASYSAPPYHLQIPRYTTPEDLSRNPSTKALDLLQHHASQYYNSHKIHELREGALKSPTSNVKVSVSSPNHSQQSSQNPNMCIPPSNSSINSSGLSLQQQQQAPPSAHPQQHTQQQPPGSSMPSSQALASGPNACTVPSGGGNGGPDLTKEPGGPGGLVQCPTPSGAPAQQPGQSASGARSPPPQRHVHTHHHTHVGLGYPMFQAPYGAVLASQQAAAAVTVISPFQTGPPTK
ncbi:zinc finger protein 608 isoform X2 [Topomyia yanbarensis]|uniref:zinc finger protein 608 isoform X2 n=1 Tax=Topomyia yanbarensis TaxID=2498891 RepID=UPI00273B7CBD|nr:zinc finger protein 608 isoform X2 [Topomyia yanbarensis]